VRLPIAIFAVTQPVSLVRWLTGARRHELTSITPWTAALTIAAAAVAYVGYVRLVERRPVRELSLRGAVPEFAAGAAIGTALIASVVGVLAAIGALRLGPGGTAAAVLPAAISLAAMSGFVEEVVVRGVVFRIVEEALGTWPAIVLSAALFGAGHLGNPGATWWSGAAIAIEAGVLLAAAYLITRRLWLAIGLHAAWNFTEAGVFGVAVSGHDVPGLLRATPAGPPLLSGGAFGAEASIVAVVLCTAAGALLLVMAARRGRLRPPPWVRSDPVV
jgi:hypothetical protein